MRFDEFNEGIDPSAKAAIKGMRELSTDEYYGLYKTMKDVAGHDGEKQTAPNGNADHEVSDKPFAYAYTDEEKNMIKGVDPKAKQITSDKSEELDEGVAEGLGAYDDDKGVKHTRGSLLAKLEALPRGSDDFEWNRNRAIQHLKQGDTLRAKYYMMLMKRGEQGVAEAGNNYHANRTGFAKPQGHRDDERHDLDVARPLIYGLKINGKIWQKDGNTVTFFTKERALAARNSILAKRPELEVGLVQRQQD